MILVLSHSWDGAKLSGLPRWFLFLAAMPYLLDAQANTDLASVTASGGTPQFTVAGTSFQAPLEVTVKDSAGLPARNSFVLFMSPASGAKPVLSRGGVFTNSAGVASVTATANNIPGSYTVTAFSLNTFLSTSFSLTNLSSGTAGALFSQLGVFRPPPSADLALGFFTLDSNGSNTFEPTDKTRPFGFAGDVPVAGDWTGSGVVRMGVVRCPASGAGVCTWYLDNNNNGQWDGTSGGDVVFQFGLPGDIPVVGDWNGSGITKAGGMRCPAVGVCTWYLDVGNKRLPTDPTNLILSYGLIGDLPAVGNWSGVVAGHAPVDQIGVFRCPAAGVCQWIVDSDGNGVWGPSDQVLAYGLPGDLPVVGNWNGIGVKRIGVFRNGQWITDTNGNGMFDAADQVFSFGLPGDKPVVGFWTVQ